MFRVTKEIHFCYAHRLLDHEGPCAHLHGHNARAEIELASDVLDAAGMVFEFGALRDCLKKWIDETMDHRTLLRQDDPLGNLLEEIGEPLFRMQQNPTAEAIAAEIFQYAREQGLPVTKVRLWETYTACAVYEE